ncbi:MULTISPECIES: UDP-3-O-(3-hydroxymyristoyl)glucosamine N-acyltransferase [unclassified Mucilaginibacter]|uniref:UDP-3-O-(3-hydroxymyristoyl)glucosamine N-acyltransferase n=1 Tax=unclassified Mucilaginibacter TaxID=2617802 RepID=UPI0031F67978
MQFTAHDISLMLNGSIEGDPTVTINKLAKIEEASAGALSFLANPKYEQFLYHTQATIVIVNTSLVVTEPVKATLIRVNDAYSAFSILLEKYNTLKLNKTGIEQPSFTDATATVGENPYIGAFAYIGAGAKMGNNCKIYPNCYIGDNVTLGNDVTLFAGAKIYADCVVGNNVIIHSGAVIGSDGFGFAPNGSGSYTKVSQIGNVVIEDNVEIGANTTIDRATMGSTIIRNGVKLDNLIQIAHNVELGGNTVIAAQTGISGSTKIGANVIIGGQAGIVGHISIAKGSQIQAQTGVNRTITEEGKKWGGVILQPYQGFLRSQLIVHQLPELKKKIEDLEKTIAELRNKQEIIH